MSKINAGVTSGVATDESDGTFRGFLRLWIFPKKAPRHRKKPDFSGFDVGGGKES